MVDKYKGKLREVYTEVELLEVSQVVVGSNRGALQMGIDSPDAEQCGYMYDIIKSFGKDIPDFDAVVEDQQDPPKPPAKNPDTPDLENSTIISPVIVNDMKELNEIMSIWKSGRVLSEKNRKIIQATIEQMNKASAALTELMQLTEPKEEGGGGKTTEVVGLDEYISNLNGMLEKIKS